MPTRKLAYLTGAPASSIARLTWEDVDFNERRFTIIRKKGRKAKWKRIPLAMTDQVFSLLILMRNQRPSDQGPVFRDSKGTPLLADRITKTGNAAIEAAGIRGVTMYCMRHALASDLTAANVATELVRQAMGHSSISTTQKYANKVPLRAIAGAIETVRGGSVAVEENGLRIKTGV